LGPFSNSYFITPDLNMLGACELDQTVSFCSEGLVNFTLPWVIRSARCMTNQILEKRIILKVNE